MITIAPGMTSAMALDPAVDSATTAIATTTTDPKEGAGVASWPGAATVPMAPATGGSTTTSSAPAAAATAVTGRADTGTAATSPPGNSPRANARASGDCSSGATEAAICRVWYPRKHEEATIIPAGTITHAVAEEEEEEAGGIITPIMATVARVV